MAKLGEYGLHSRIHNKPVLREVRRELRNHQTLAEQTLWDALKKKGLGGRKFRRQHSIDRFIVDFYCPEEKLAIELDGQGHFECAGKEYDKQRMEFLGELGIRVLRFENCLILKNLDAVLEEIKSFFHSNEF